jgi:predicted RNA binding protein YcfA (HicA-like mRNA interferase family)
MTGKLPRITAHDMIAVLEKGGFIFSRASGSHKIYKHPNGKRVTVPYHGSKILHPKILKSILNDADLTLDKLQSLL